MAQHLRRSKPVRMRLYVWADAIQGSASYHYVAFAPSALAAKDLLIDGGVRGWDGVKLNGKPPQVFTRRTSLSFNAIPTAV